jgi:hypothetical protein
MRGVEPGRNCRPEDTERVEAFGPRPLRKGRILRDDVGGGDVIDARVAEDGARGLGLARIAASLADDDPKLALVDDLAFIGEAAAGSLRRCP